MKFLLTLLLLTAGCASIERAVETTTEVVVDKIPTIIFAGFGFVIGGLPGGMAGAAIGDTISDAVEAKIDVELLEQTNELIRQGNTVELDGFKDKVRELEGLLVEAERVKTTMDLIIAVWPWLVIAAIAIAALLYFQPPPFQGKKK